MMSSYLTPAAYSLLPGYAATMLNPAINAVKNTNFEELRKNPKRQITPVENNIFLPLLNDLVVALHDLRENTLVKFTPEQAQEFLNELPIPEDLIAEFRLHVASGTPSNDASELEKITFNLTTIIVGIWDDATLFADPTPVDEDSADYHAFLGRLAEGAETEQGQKFIYGRKAVLALFD